MSRPSKATSSRRSHLEHSRSSRSSVNSPIASAFFLTQTSSLARGKMSDAKVDIFFRLGELFVTISNPFILACIKNYRNILGCPRRPYLKHPFEVLGKSPLNQSAFTNDVSNHGYSPDHGRHSGHNPKGAVEIEFCKILCSQYRFQTRGNLLAKSLQPLS